MKIRGGTQKGRNRAEGVDSVERAGEAADGGVPVYSAAATKRKGGAKRGTAPIPENC